MENQNVEEQREKVIENIVSLLRTNRFSVEFKVMKKPRGIRIIHEVTQEQMDDILKNVRVVREKKSELEEPKGKEEG